MVGVGRARPLLGQDGRVVRVAQVSQFTVGGSGRFYCCLPSVMNVLKDLFEEDFPKTSVLSSPEVEAFKSADLSIVQIFDR